MDTLHARGSVMGKGNVWVAIFFALAIAGCGAPPDEKTSPMPPAFPEANWEKDSAEPDDTPENAAVFIEGTETIRTLAPLGDEDWFQLQSETGAPVNILWTSSDLPLDVRAYAVEEGSGAGPELTVMTLASQWLRVEAPTRKMILRVRTHPSIAETGFYILKCFQQQTVNE